jgi:hypothetical protein
MESRSVDDRRSKRVKVEGYEEVIEDAPQTTVRLRLLKSITLNYTGPITGQKYVFSGSGSVVEVDAEDATIMLEKKGGRPCCPTSVGPQPYFELVR